MKKSSTLAICLSLLIFLAACATPPNKLENIVYTLDIRKVACEDLSYRLAIAQDKVVNLTIAQKRIVRHDRGVVTGAVIFGASIILWPLALIALAVKGDGMEATDLKEAKGVVKALKNELASPRCEKA